MSGSGVGRWGFFMAGRSSKGCQKLHWEILCVHHLGDCWPCVLCGCEIFLNLFTNGGIFSCDGISSHNKHVWWNENSLRTLHCTYHWQFLLNVWGGIISSGALLFSSAFAWQCWTSFLKNILPYLLQDAGLLNRIHLRFIFYGAPYHFLLTFCAFLKSVFQNDA